MEYQLLINNLNNIYNNTKPKLYQELEKLYCNIMIYKNDIKKNVSKSLFDKYKKETDDLMFEIILFDNDNYDNNNNIISSFFVMLKEIIEYLKSNFKFNEDNFVSSILNKYYHYNNHNHHNTNDNDIIEFIDIFIDDYTRDNSIDFNIFLINKYSNIENAITLFKEYYRINFNFKETKTDYADLAAIVLFHNFYEKIYHIIIDDYDSSNDTIEEK